MKRTFTLLLLCLSALWGYGQVLESFETGLPTSYTTATSYTLNSGTWTGQASGVIRGNTGATAGSYSLQLRNQTGAQITTPTLSGGVAVITFNVQASTASGGLQIRISTDDGVTWSQVTGSPISFGTTNAAQSFTVNNSNVDKVQFYRTGATVYIDEVSITAFTASCTAPTNQATSGSASSIANTTATLSWTKGASSDGSIVVLNGGSAVSSNPTNGTAHTADAAYGSGAALGSSADYVVFRNTSGTNVNLTGLTAATTYHYAIYDYMSTGDCYNLTSPATGSFTTTCSTPGDVTGAAATDENTESEVSWTLPSCYDEIVIFADVTSGIGTSPSGDGSLYTANSVYSTVGQCVYKGTGTDVTVTGLTNGTTYNFEIFTRKGTTWSNGVEVNATPAIAGLIISATGTTYTIDFDNTVSGVNNGAFTGSGFVPNPTSGQLNSGAWSLTGMSDGALAFNGTGTTGDYARGTSNGGVTTGGVYAKTLGTGDIALGIQPGSSDFTPGTITLKTANTTGSSITHIEIAYDVYVYNDQGRSNNLNFSYSTDDVTYTDISALDVVSEEIALITPSWERNSRFALITLPSSLVTSSNFYLRWSGDGVSGSGSVDEFAIDNIAVRFHTTAPIALSNNISSANLASLAVSGIDATLGSSQTLTTLTIENTVLTLGNFTLATDTITGGSATAFINTNGTGVVRKNTSSTGSFTYPIGTGSDYTPITLDFTAGAFSSAYVDVRALASKHANNMSSTDYLDRYWEINASGITSFTCDVVATYVAGDVQGTEANIYGGLYSSGVWSIGNSTNTANKSVSIGGVSHFSDFSGGEQSVLPVSYSSFTATAKVKEVELHWETASEFNNSHFDVLHSVDGKQYEEIGEVLGNGNSSVILNYVYSHDNPAKINYYKLRQVDFDGATQLSQPLAVRFDTDANSVVIKNHINKFEILFTNDDQQLHYQLLDNTARVLVAEDAKGSIVIDKTELAQGQYFLYINGERNFKVIKLIK